MSEPSSSVRHGFVTEPAGLPGLRASLRASLREALQSESPREVCQRFLAGNDALIRQPVLDHGSLIVAGREAIYTELVRAWAERECRRSGYDKPFAVVALGGTGRGEVTPRSDLDYAFLFDDRVEGNSFLVELQSQTMGTDAFFEEHGFRFEPLPFNFDDVPSLGEKQLNSFIDLRAIHDPTGLAGRFIERIRATYDPFEHFLHVRGFWVDRWERAAEEAERLDAFDIKNDGLRLFLAGIWTLAGRQFHHSHEIYQQLEDPRDLEAYHFLLRIRCFVHLNRPRARRAAGGDHPEDKLVFRDFTSFGDLLGPDADEKARFEFANDVRARLIAARRRVARFAKSVIARELTPGRQVSPSSPLIYRQAGLAMAGSATHTGAVARSRAALSLLLASQRYRVPIDPAELEATFRDAGDWLTPVPELSALFYERRGSLARSFEFLAQFDGAQERLFPGYAKFETSLDARVTAEQRWLRGALERRKLEALENFLRDGKADLARAISTERALDLGEGVNPAIEAALLGNDHLAAVKLAIKTKRLPLTLEDIEVRNDQSRPLHERFSSGTSDIPLARYFDDYLLTAEFPEETLRVTRFLIEHRRALKSWVDSGLNDASMVEDLAKLCGDEHLLRSLFVFTCADRTDWESRTAERTRWFSIDELYAKTMQHFRPSVDPRQRLRNSGFSPDELAILEDFGPDFFGGVYRPHAVTFGTHLLKLAQDPESNAKATLLRTGTACIVGVAARDFRGLAACITGELWRQQVDLEQAHLFSAMNSGLVLDFFHVMPNDRALNPELARGIERAILQRRHIGDDAQADLPRLNDGRTSLRAWRNGLYLLRHETTRKGGGLVYSLAYQVFRHLGGNIFGLRAQETRQGAYVSIYLGLPTGMTAESAAEIVRDRFA